MTFSQRARRLALGATVVLALALAALPALAADHAVNIVDRTYDPTQITISAGDTVTWTVTKAIGEPHSVTSGKPDDADKGSEFDSGVTLTENGQTFEHTFATPGTYDYFCTVHGAAMSGVVTVAEAASSAEPSGAPSAAASPSRAPASEAPAASPAGSPGGSEGPGASPEPEVHDPVPVENRVIGAAILIGSLVLLFGANMVWRRVNKA